MTCRGGSFLSANTCRNILQPCAAQYERRDGYVHWPGQCVTLISSLRMCSTHRWRTKSLFSQIALRLLWHAWVEDSQQLQSSKYKNSIYTIQKPILCNSESSLMESLLKHSYSNHDCPKVYTLSWTKTTTLKKKHLISSTRQRSKTKPMGLKIHNTFSVWCTCEMSLLNIYEFS